MSLAPLGRHEQGHPDQQRWDALDEYDRGEAQQPEVRLDGEEGRVPEEVEPGRRAKQQPRHDRPHPGRTFPTGDDVGHAGTGQCGEQRVAPQPAKEAAHQECADHRLDRVDAFVEGDRPDREHHVFHQLEAEPDQGPVNETVDHAVDLARCHTRDRDHTGNLDQLLHRRAGHGRAPSGRRRRRDQLGQKVLQRRAAIERGGRGHHPAPEDGQHLQPQRLPLQVVDHADE